MPTLRGHHAVSGLGVALLAAAVVQHGAEIAALDSAIGPLLALALDGGIAVGVIVAGRWIARQGLSAAEERRVARWTCSGTVLAVAAFSATLAVRAAEGRPLVEPVFPILVAAGAGSLGGAVAGYYAVRQAADARRARDAVRAVSFVNHLLRHDLRNDLSAIHGYAGLIDGDDPDAADHLAVVTAKAEEGIDRIEATSAVADAILGDADDSRVDLAATTRRVLASVDDDSSVTVETDLPETAPVAANEGVRSIVDNLVENAVDHAGPEVTVRVQISEGPANVTLAVEDDGPGLPPDLRDAPFTPDWQADEPVTGLGLVATLTEAYGGSLSACESDLGGARFEVRLPRPEAGS